MADSLPYYTWEEVAQHTTRANGVWVVIEGNVYDVTKFLDEVGVRYLEQEVTAYIRYVPRFLQHPGGEDVLMENAGELRASVMGRAIRTVCIVISTNWVYFPR